MHFLHRGARGSTLPSRECNNTSITTVHASLESTLCFPVYRSFGKTPDARSPCNLVLTMARGHQVYALRLHAIVGCRRGLRLQADGISSGWPFVQVTPRCGCIIQLHAASQAHTDTQTHTRMHAPAWRSTPSPSLRSECGTIPWSWTGPKACQSSRALQGCPSNTPRTPCVMAPTQTRSHTNRRNLPPHRSLPVRAVVAT